MKGKFKLTMIFIMVAIIFAIIVFDKYRCFKNHKDGNTLAELKKQLGEIREVLPHYDEPQGA